MFPYRCAHPQESSDHVQASYTFVFIHTVFVDTLESCYLLLSFKMLSMLIFIFFSMKIPLLAIFAVIEQQKCNTLGNTECR